jgi:hypothetical protein
MCSGSLRLLSAAGLEPDYSLEWKILMHRLVKFLLGDQVSAETWKDRELAVIKSNGCVLGKVSKVESNINSGGNIQSVEAVFGNTAGERRGRTIRWLSGPQQDLSKMVILSASFKELHSLLSPDCAKIMSKLLWSQPFLRSR